MHMQMYIHTDLAEDESETAIDVTMTSHHTISGNLAKKEANDRSMNCVTH